MIALLHVLALAGAPGPTLPSVAVAQEAVPSALETLLAAYAAERRAWYEKMIAAPPEQKAALFAAHPARDYWARVRALADAGAGGAWKWLVANAIDAGQPGERVAREALDAAGHDAAVLAAVCELLESYAPELDQDASIEVLREALARAPDDASRAGVATALGTLLSASADAARREEGLELLRAIAEAFAGQEVGQRADDQIFRVERLATGCLAPAFEGASVDGAPLRLADARGKVVVIDFFGFWCGPCVGEIPHLRALAQRMQGRPFALLGVDCFDEEPVFRAKAAALGVTWPVVFQGGATPVSDLYRVRSWPTVFVLDGEGRIVAEGLRGEALDARVEALVAALEARR